MNGSGREGAAGRLDHDIPRKDGAAGSWGANGGEHDGKDDDDKEEKLNEIYKKYENSRGKFPRHPPRETATVGKAPSRDHIELAKRKEFPVRGSNPGLVGESDKS